MRVLGLIPARGGSKGVPRKNIKPLAGKPLLAYTVEAALAAKLLARVILSTDDQEIAEVGKMFGAEVPFLRPADLAKDQTPTLPVVQHALKYVEENGDWFDAVCLLQPTNPLRQAADIDACIKLMEQCGADSVVSVLPVPAEYNPHWVYFRDTDGSLRLSTGESSPIPRRQELPPAFHREGSIYVSRCDVVIKENSLYGAHVVGYEVDSARSVNIDTPEDWEYATELISRYGLNQF
ncbi:MAG: acylneuraminate cytidylyltransferase family protein [Blastocatellales bacterium]